MNHASPTLPADNRSGNEPNRWQRKLERPRMKGGRP